MAQRNLKSITFEGLPIKYLIPTTGVVDLGEDPEFFDKLDSFVEEGNYKVSDGDFVYTVKIERPSENTVGQTYWSTEEGIGTAYARTGWFDGESWSFNIWDAPLYSDNAHNLFADKQHVHYLMKSTDNFEEWIDNYTPGSFRVLDSTTQKYYYVSAEGYSAALNGRLRRYQSYFEATEPWKVYSRTGSAAVGNSGYITWDAWHCVDDSLPTPEDIGAAPAGYGLGEVMEFSSIENIDNLYLSGNYRFFVDGGFSVAGVNLWSFYMRVDGYDENNCTQTIYCGGTGAGVIRRTKYSTWGEWEWENPPMVLGVEYRTTERCNGKAVYAVRLDLGTFGAGIHTVDTGISATSVVRTSNMPVLFDDPIFNQNYMINVDTYTHGILNCRVVIGELNTAVNVINTLWYTKD